MDDGRLGDDSPVVAIVVGIEEFPEEVTTFVSIAVWGTVWHSRNWIGTINCAKISVVRVSMEPREATSRFKMIYSFEICLGRKVCNSVASKDPCWSSFCLNGGGGGSSVTDGRTRSLHDWQRLRSSPMWEYPRQNNVF
jgi:hypothetical protein